MFNLFNKPENNPYITTKKVTVWGESDGVRRSLDISAEHIHAVCSALGIHWRDRRHHIKSDYLFHTCSQIESLVNGSRPSEEVMRYIPALKELARKTPNDYVMIG